MPSQTKSTQSRSRSRRHRYGELPWAELVQIYRDTLNLVVFAGLDSLGVDTSKGRAWLEERTGA